MPSKRRSSSGKTFPACSHRKTTDSVVSWARSLDSMSPCLSHPGTGAGPVRVWLPDPKEPSHGAFSTLNISECPNDAVASSLSDVLEPLESIPQKYFLSPRACLGILRRAAKRGKRLPALLRAALAEMAGVPCTEESPVADMPEVAPTFLASYGQLPNNGDHPFVIPQTAFGGNRSSAAIEVATARSAHPGPSGRLDFETETFVVATRPPDDSPAREESVAPRAFSCKDRGADAGPVAPTLRAMGHRISQPNAGGQVAVVFPHPLRIFACFRAAGQDGGCGLGPKNRPAESPPMRSSQEAATIAFDCKAGGKTSFSVGPVAGALRGVGHGGGHAAVAVARTPARYCVRRLTPKEAERLQGLPDDYTRFIANSVANADGPRYKMIGNSFAVPVVAWIGRKIRTACLRAPSSCR